MAVTFFRGDIKENGDGIAITEVLNDRIINSL